jgi:sugar phosphate isomerase/epimerase
MMQERAEVMRITRRDFIGNGAVAIAGAGSWRFKSGLTTVAVRGVKFKIGVPDWSLRQEAKVECIGLAKKIGFDGVQISLGVSGISNNGLLLSDEGTQRAFLEESRRIGIPITSVCLNILHRNYLKSDQLGQRWVAESIPIAKALGVRVILLPFFGKGALLTAAEMDYVGDALREIAPAAERSGVTLGLEDTISARDNVRIIERTKSAAVLVYYDVGNSTLAGFDIIKEIQWLGRDRICEVHLKDNPHFLGQGKIDFTAVVDALAGIGYDKWAQLETDCPTGSVENDMARNLKFIRDVIARR